jgi:3D-(3,5/4)-trihydroxycyclohexane-1,2-dione acylhydrolase (decyclizing)
VINKLQKNTGNASFNTLFADCPTIPEPVPVDFAAHARAMGCLAEEVTTLDDFAAAFTRARTADRTSVIVMSVDPHDGWTEQGHSWWEVGLAEISPRDGITKAREGQAKGRARQRQGI